MTKQQVKDADTAGGQAPGAVVDFLAFLAVLVFVAGLTLLLDRTAQLPARIVFSGALGLAAGCITAWRRLRRPKPRRWRSGQAVYRGRRVQVVHAWGVEDQPLPAIMPSATSYGDSSLPREREQQEPR
jgi:hypothetical protein